MFSQRPTRTRQASKVTVTLLAVGICPLLGSSPLGLVSGWTEQTPVFRSSAERVRVDVVVTDGKGTPLSDLTLADFSIVENGRSQKISDFERVHQP